MRYRLLGNFHMSGSACGTTRFAVADGTLTLHGKARPTQVVSGLSHDKDNANGHIDKLLDKEKVDNQLTFAQGVQQLAGQIAHDVNSYKPTKVKKEAVDKLL